MQSSSIFKRLVLKEVQRLYPVQSTGRPKLLTDEVAFECMMKVCRTGSQWREVNGSVHFSTVYKRMRQWSASGVFEQAYRSLLRVYKRLNPTKWYCVDSSYVKNVFGRENVGKNHTDRGRKALKTSVSTLCKDLSNKSKFEENVEGCLS